MPLELHESTATVVGTLAVEEVADLVTWLRETARPRINLRRASHLHTAAVRALIAFRPKVSGLPADPFIARQVLPLLQASGPDRSGDQ